MTRISRRKIAHCTYVRGLHYIERYLASLGWTPAAPEVPLRLRAPLDAIGVGGGVTLERDVLATLTRTASRRGLEDKIDVNWRPAGDGPFPAFSGTLMLAAAAPKACELLLDGTYEPPLGIAGKAFDAVAGRRIAEATADTLLETIADFMETAFAQDEPHVAR